MPSETTNQWGQTRLKNTSQQSSKNKSSSASLGVSVNLGLAGGVGVTAGLTSGKGNTIGNGTTWTETQIQSGHQQGDTVTLNSGKDTNLIGAQVSGNQIQANVGTSGTGNLNIQSLQDTDYYKGKQSNTGISITAPLTGTGLGGSITAGNSKINSNYQSVNEQSGIYAGDEGFQISTQGNTHLKGAVIASTDKAIQDNKNSLTTQTLTTSNIENSAEYEAKGTSATVGYGTQGGLPQLSGAGIGQDEGNANSTTVSAVSAGEVNIKEGDITKTQLSLDVHVERNSEGNVIALNGQGNNLAATVNPIFDAEKIAKEINAQVQITEAFGQQAGQAVASYVRAQRTALLTQYKNATTDTEKLEIKAQMDEVTREERVMNILIGAVTGMAGTAVTKEGLSITADYLRQLMIEDSKKFPGVTDGTTTLTNTSGESKGVRGDGEKVGGTRIDLDKLCGTSNERCAKNPDGSLALNGNNQVVWDAKDKNGNSISLATFLETDQGKEAYGTTGGIQGWKGTLFGTPYAAGSWQDKLIEAFSGTHDFVGGKLSGLYDEQGNATRGRSEELQKLQDAWSASGAIVIASPFAMAEFLEPQVWQAISILLKGSK